MHTCTRAYSYQNKIVSAGARYGKSDWVWREEAASEQNFWVCNSASFKAYDHEVRQEPGCEQFVGAKTLPQLLCFHSANQCNI